ncbi:NAD(P)H-dependent oxidoreductase [Leucobacter sp. GX24907]
MHALVVVSHPFTGSFSHAMANQVIAGLTEAGHTAELADLAAEGFDPRFTFEDYETYKRQTGPVPDDVRAEQQRIERADALVFAFPVYWWSLPGLLKGWFDRVFTGGWGYGSGPDGQTSNLGGIDVHLLAMTETSIERYERRGYREAIRTQIESGIFGYCGGEVCTAELFPITEENYAERHLARAQEIGASVFAPRTN